MFYRLTYTVAMWLVGCSGCQGVMWLLRSSEWILTQLYCCEGVCGCQGVVVWLLRCSEWVLTHFYAIARVFMVSRVLVCSC